MKDYAYDWPEQAVWLIFYQNRILLTKNPEGQYRLPDHREIAVLPLDLRGAKNIGEYEGAPHYTVELFQETVLPDRWRFVNLLYLFMNGPKGLYKLAGRAVQIVDWARTHRFCGQCGAATEEKPKEFAKVCPKCGFTGYPRISPSIIVAVTKGRELLLVRSKHFANYAFHTVISGFVEPGETLEECLEREVKEETGLAVKNIRYYGSQPWPFPNSLMLAFTAEYASGEIVVDDEELYEAAWYSVERLPFLPSSDSIARGLIDWFIENNPK